MIGNMYFDTICHSVAVFFGHSKIGFTLRTLVVLYWLNLQYSINILKIDFNLLLLTLKIIFEDYYLRGGPQYLVCSKLHNLVRLEQRPLK